MNQTIGEHVGTLLIPALFLKKTLYKPVPGQSQKVVDEKDSAAYMLWDGMPVIADHADQGGTWRLHYSIPGVTLAILKIHGENNTYKCSKKQKGTIRGNKMFDESG